ncbi:hypothetical protein AS589_09315 [Empedobacter brevis]|uniref:hypothetical protein n=1 Tax=Empedobacter brevis TaxID=247 RepID=UPI00131F5D5B|nr:hypothetical protein [Empedobacter brevis]QHC84954.1 hypothetical protein AS589_09315 [Empedobacter brevis]
MENENRISDLIDGGIQKENELFNGTKGEWKVDSSFAEMVIDSNNDDICKVSYRLLNSKYEYKYNALLISKAPEMLEKLQESTEVIKWYMENSTSELPETFFNIGANQIEQNELLIKQATEL